MEEQIDNNTIVRIKQYVKNISLITWSIEMLAIVILTGSTINHYLENHILMKDYLQSLYKISKPVLDLLGYSAIAFALLDSLFSIIDFKLSNFIFKSERKFIFLYIVASTLLLLLLKSVYHEQNFKIWLISSTFLSISCILYSYQQLFHSSLQKNSTDSYIYTIFLSHISILISVIFSVYLSIKNLFWST